METEESTTRNEQFYDTGQDFLDPFEGDVSNEDLRRENNLNDPLSSGAWTPTFVYEGTKQGSTPGQSEYDSVDSSMESTHSLNRSDNGEAPGQARVVVVPKSWIPILTSTPKFQFNQKQIREAKRLGEYNAAGNKEIPLSELPPKRHDRKVRK